MRGLVGQPDGSQVITGEVRGPAEQAEQLGIGLAEELLARGADVILTRIFHQ